MAFDPSHGDLVPFGGGGCFSGCGTRTFSGATWTEAKLTGSPLDVYGEGLAEDAVDNGVLLYGGNLASSGARTCATWLFSHGNRSETSALFPPQRVEPTRGWHASPGKVILFGGTYVTTGNLPGVTYNDTWTFSGGCWTQLTPPTSPGARSGAGGAEDPASGTFVIAGGCGPAGCRTPIRGATGTSPRSHSRRLELRAPPSPWARPPIARRVARGSSPGTIPWGSWLRGLHDLERLPLGIRHLRPQLDVGAERIPESDGAGKWRFGPDLPGVPSTGSSTGPLSNLWVWVTIGAVVAAVAVAGTALAILRRRRRPGAGIPPEGSSESGPLKETVFLPSTDGTKSGGPIPGGMPSSKKRAPNVRPYDPHQGPPIAQPQRVAPGGASCPLHLRGRR